MNLFCSHLTATLTLLTLGRIKVDHASAFDFVEFASAQHSLSKLNSVLAYSQSSPLIPLCGLDFAHARQNQVWLASALA